MEIPRAVGRGHRGRRGRRVRLVAVVCSLVSGVSAVAAADERVTLRLTARSLSIPAGAFSLDQRALGAAIGVSPARWIVFETGLERTTTELSARRLDVRPFEVETSLGLEHRWGFFHSLSLRTHEVGPLRLEAFCEARWMPGSARAQVQDLVLAPLDIDLSAFGRLADLLGARLAWWQSALGARAALSVPPLELWIDGGATWVHLQLHWALTADGRDLGALVSDGPVDSRGRFTVDEAQPFGRAGARLAVPGPFELDATAGAVPTTRGLAFVASAGLAWVIE